MKVIFTFSDSSTYESSIIRQGFSCQEILFNRLQASDGFVGFSIPFSTTFSNKMTADINNNVLAVVYDDNNNPYATGFVKKEVGYEQKYRNQPIKITIVSKSYMLDKTLNESYALESQTSAQIVTWLLTQAGISDIGSLSSMTTTVPLFVFNAGENIKDVLKEFCFEYSKTFYFDKNGYFQVADLFVSSFTASQSFDRSNIRDRVNINVKEAEANCIRGRWTPLFLVSDTLVFEDKQNATSQYDCVIPIAANSWFGGVEDNFLKCDSTLGEVKYVKAITQNNIQSDSGITKTLDLLERTSLNQLHFTAKNTTASVKNITKMQVYANAYIAKENRVDVTTYGNKEKELSLKYIQDQTTAQSFVKALADYYNSTSFTVSFSSDEVCDIGDLVTVSADGIGSFNCRIIQRTRNIITDTIDYVCENIGDYTPAVIVQTVQEPLAVNIAGGQKGLDGAPGTPGEAGKNAITMTSSTTPSGEYNGQMGFWQGQPYMWNGSSWVKQIGDLPTDAVLHYSFDEVPDYPDGIANVRLLDNNTYDIQSTNYRFYNNGGTTFTNNNGKLQFATESTDYWNGCYIEKSTTNNKVIKLKFRITAISSSVLLYTSDDSTYMTFDKIGEYTISVYAKTVNTTFSFVVRTGNSVTVIFDGIYIGNGSYSTPIIDNANGQNNATNNGGIAVQGVSGKGLLGLGRKNIVTTSTFPKPTDKSSITLSIWVKYNGNYTDTGSRNLFGTGSYNNSFCIYQQATSGNKVGLVAFIRNASSSQRSIVGYISDNEWHNAVMIWKNKTLSFYIDGVLLGSQSLDVSDYTFGSNYWRIGDTGVVQGNEPPVIGTIEYYVDDAQIFDRALSETEVLALYQNKANTPKYYDLSDYIVEGIDDDGVISPSEKEILYQKWIDIYAVLNGTTINASSNANGEYSKMIARATTAGVSLVIQGGEGLNYINATEALRAGLWTTANLANMSVQTQTSAGAIDTLFNNYRNAYEALSTAIDVQNKATASALSIVQSNSYHQVPTDAGGSPVSLVGTDNTIYLLEGESKLECVSSSTTLTAGKWKITGITYTGCTAKNPQNPSAYTPTSDKGAFIDVLSDMTDESAKRTFTISFFANNASSEDTLTVVQSFAKAKAGADGSTYQLLATAQVVKTGTSVRFDAIRISGDSKENYSDGWLYSSPDGTVWSQVGQFKTNGNYNYRTVTVSANTIFRLCKSESSSSFVDELSVNLYADGHSPTVTATKTGTQTTIYVDGVEQATIDDGTNGTNTWNSTASATSSTTSIALNTITVITGHSVSAGDLIIANGLLFYVTAVSSTTATVTYKQKIKGDTGGTGNFTKRIPLYYVSTSTTAPSAPSSRVTSTTTATTTTWTQGIYNTYAVGKYYYTCEQIEVYNNAGTYQSCSWSTVSRDTEYENASLAKLRSAGQYIGTKSASFTAYTGSSNWDWFLATANFTQQSVSIVAGNVYVWNGSTWTRDTDTSHLSATMKDMMALIDSYTTGSTDIATYATVLAQTLAVQKAFINKLMLNKLHLIKSGQDIGAIYGGKYDEDGNVDPQSTDTKGVYLDADGKLKCIDGEFEGTIQSGNYSQNTNGYKFDNDGNCYVNGKMTLSGSSEIEIQKSKYSGGDYIGIHSSNYSKSQAYGFNISAFSDGSSVTSIARFNNIDCKSISGWKRSDESSSYITFDANAFRITGSLGFAGITVIRLSDGYSTIRSKIKLLYDRYSYMLSSYIFVKGHYKITQVGQTGTIYEEDVCFIAISIVNNNYRIATYNEKGSQAWFDIKTNGIDVVSPSSTYGFTINVFNFIHPS